MEEAAAAAEKCSELIEKCLRKMRPAEASVAKKTKRESMGGRKDVDKYFNMRERKRALVNKVSSSKGRRT